MSKPLTLYCDGSVNQSANQVGWAYLIVHDDEVILAESGVIRGGGSATHGEYQAVIRGLLAIPAGVRVHVITDRDDIGDMVKHPHRQKSKKALVSSYRRAICKLIHPRNIKVRVIKSGSVRWHRRADDLARHACGLQTKNQMKRASRKRQMCKEENNA